MLSGLRLRRPRAWRNSVAVVERWMKANECSLPVDIWSEKGHLCAPIAPSSAVKAHVRIRCGVGGADSPRASS